VLPVTRAAALSTQSINQSWIFRVA